MRHPWTRNRYRKLSRLVAISTRTSRHKHPRKKCFSQDFHSSSQSIHHKDFYLAAIQFIAFSSASLSLSPFSIETRHTKNGFVFSDMKRTIRRDYGSQHLFFLVVCLKMEVWAGNFFRKTRSLKHVKDFLLLSEQPNCEALIFGVNPQLYNVTLDPSTAMPWDSNANLWTDSVVLFWWLGGLRELPYGVCEGEAVLGVAGTVSRLWS